jgi:hypothetical protein
LIRGIIRAGPRTDGRPVPVDGDGATLCGMTNPTANPAEWQPRASAAVRTIRILVGCYLGLSALTLVVAVLLGDDPVLVPDSVWIRGIIVLISSVLVNAFAARGSRAAWRRVWLFCAVMAVAIVVIIAIPGVFPTHS